MKIELTKTELMEILELLASNPMTETQQDIYDRISTDILNEEKKKEQMTELYKMVKEDVESQYSHYPYDPITIKDVELEFAKTEKYDIAKLLDCLTFGSGDDEAADDFFEIASNVLYNKREKFNETINQSRLDKVTNSEGVFLLLPDKTVQETSLTIKDGEPQEEIFIFETASSCVDELFER